MYFSSSLREDGILRQLKQYYCRFNAITNENWNATAPLKKQLNHYMKKIVFTLLTCVALVSVSNAQDIHFSQFFASPLTLNPALTGKFDGSFRISGNFRDQWPAYNNVYVTKTTSFDFGILKNRLSEMDQMGVGLLGATDNAASGTLITNTVGLSLSFHKGLDENGFHQIGAGFQTSYTNKRLDITKLLFTDQLTPLGFTGVTNEIFSNKQVNVSYVDINAGVLYNGSTNGYNNFYIGASMYHINRPKETFKGGEHLVSARTTIQAGSKIPVGSYNSLHFSTIFATQAKTRNIVFGGAFCLNANQNGSNPTNIYFGAWARFNSINDAIIPYIGLEFGPIHIGYSYDINVSSLKTATNSVGGNEVSLIFKKKPIDPNSKKLNCPRF